RPSSVRTRTCKPPSTLATSPVSPTSQPMPLGHGLAHMGWPSQISDFRGQHGDFGLVAPANARDDEVDVVAHGPKGSFPHAGCLTAMLGEQLSDPEQEFMPAQPFDQRLKLAEVFLRCLQTRRRVGPVDAVVVARCGD